MDVEIEFVIVEIRNLGGAKESIWRHGPDAVTIVRHGNDGRPVRPGCSDMERCAPYCAAESGHPDKTRKLPGGLIKGQKPDTGGAGGDGRYLAGTFQGGKSDLLVYLPAYFPVREC